MTCQLYRHFDADGQLLYVSISLRAVRRPSEHRATPWSSQVARVNVEKFPTRQAALAAKREAIHAEGPTFNRVHVGMQGINYERLPARFAAGTLARKLRRGVDRISRNGTG